MLGELVVCKITKMNPNSAFAELEEYGKEGMIHISEVSSGWVRDIRSFLKAGQSVIAKVTRIDDQGHISLSLKRVDSKQEKDKMREYKLNQRAEKMLEIAAKKLNKPLNKAYEEVGYTMQEKFGTMYDAFKTSLTNPDTLRNRGINEEWLKVIIEVAEKNIEKKEFEFSANLFIKTVKPNGIVIIKNILKTIEKSGLEVHYIAAPKYLVKMKTMNAKKGEHEMEEKLKKAAAESKDAEITFELIK